MEIITQCQCGCNTEIISHSRAYAKRKYLKGHIPKLVNTKAKNYRGGRVYTTDGYAKILSPNHPFKTKSGYVFEHRLVMEQHLGRYLTKQEDVHHINHIKGDNRIENLKVVDHYSHSIYHLIQIACNNWKKHNQNDILYTDSIV